MRTITKEELTKTLEQHKLWLTGDGGKKANLSYSDLSDSDLSDSDLSDSDLSDSDLRGSNLRGSNLRGSDLRGSDLRDSNLSYSDLSGVKGLLDPIDWMYQNLEKIDEGYLAYKSFGSNFEPPAHWKIAEESELTEIINPLPTLDCACGINVATLKWVKDNNKPNTPIWQVLIKWEWLPGVVVPYNTDGKFRCSRVKLLRRV